MTPQTKPNLKLTDEDTRKEAIERLGNYFPLQIDGYDCTDETVYDVLVKAAVTGQTIETVCNNLDEMVNGETIRGYLNEQVRADDLHSLEQQGVSVNSNDKDDVKLTPTVLNFSVWLVFSIRLSTKSMVLFPLFLLRLNLLVYEIWIY